MKTNTWFFIVLVVTALNAWAAYMTAICGFSLIPSYAVLVGISVGIVTYVLGRSITA